MALFSFSFGFTRTDRKLLRSIAKGVVIIMASAADMRKTLGEINAATDDLAEDINNLIEKLDEAADNGGLSESETDEFAAELESARDRLKGVASEYPKEGEDAPVDETDPFNTHDHSATEDLEPKPEEPKETELVVDGVDNVVESRDGIVDMSKDGAPGREAVLDNDKVNAEFGGGFSGANPMVDPGRAGASVPEVTHEEAEAKRDAREGDEADAEI